MIRESGIVFLFGFLWLCLCLGTGIRGDNQSQDAPSPLSLFSEAHFMSSDFRSDDHAFVLYQIANGARNLNAADSKAWSLELFRLAKSQMNLSDGRVMQKNALVVLSGLDPETTVELFRQQDLPDSNEDEDNRVWAAGPLFSSLWHNKKEKSFQTIRDLATFMGDTGEYPYNAIADVMSDLDQVNQHQLANDLFTDAEYAYGGSTRRFLDAPENYVQFLLRVHSIVNRPSLVASVRNLVDQLKTASQDDKTKIEIRTQVENKSGIHSFNSWEDAILYRLLPLIKDIDPELAKSILRDNQRLSSETLSSIDEDNTLRGVAFQNTPGNQPDISGTFDQQRVQEVLTQSEKDPKKAMLAAKGIATPDLRDIAIASILPEVLAANAADGSHELSDIEKRLTNMRPNQRKLQLEVALTKCYFASHREAEARALVDKAFDLGAELVAEDMLARPGLNTYAANGAQDLFSLASYLAEISPEPRNALQAIESLHDNVLRGELLTAFGQGLVKRKPRN